MQHLAAVKLVVSCYVAVEVILQPSFTWTIWFIVGLTLKHIVHCSQHRPSRLITYFTTSIGSLCPFDITGLLSASSVLPSPLLFTEAEELDLLGLRLARLGLVLGEIDWRGGRTSLT